MRRWHQDWHVMARHIRIEKWAHDSQGERYEDCHCFDKPGLFRKTKPLATSSLPRYFRKIAQHEARRRVKALRRWPVPTM